MRKIISLFIAFITSSLPLFTYAEELLTYTFPQTYHWSQTYHAHERTIPVNIIITVPDTLALDILTVHSANSSLSDEQIARYADLEKTFSFNPNNSESFLGMGINNPFIMLPGQKGGKCRTWMLDLEECDPNISYAENNPVTLSQAWDIFRSEVAYCYGDKVAKQLVIDEVQMRDRLKVYNKKTHEYGEPLREYGSYQFTALQSFHSVPVLCHIASAFQDSIRGEHFMLQTALIGVIANEESFHFRFSLIEEDHVVAEKVPICSVEDAIVSLEEYITQGRIRNIYSVKLVYTLWNDSNDKENYYLIPCWVAECDYYSTAKKKENKNDADAEHYTDRTCYQKIMVNAITGKIIDPEDKSKTRCEVHTDWFKK